MGCWHLQNFIFSVEDDLGVAVTELEVNKAIVVFYFLLSFAWRFRLTHFHLWFG
jgi:hypothetical protein